MTRVPFFYVFDFVISPFSFPFLFLYYIKLMVEGVLVCVMSHGCWYGFMTIASLRVFLSFFFCPWDYPGYCGIHYAYVIIVAVVDISYTLQCTAIKQDF
jgi:hypothetical protein